MMRKATKPEDNSVGAKPKGVVALTYETAIDISAKLSTLTANVQHLLERAANSEEDDKALEGRLRTQEIAIAALAAQRAQSSSVWVFIWGAIISVITVTIQAATLLVLVMRGHG